MKYTSEINHIIKDRVPLLIKWYQEPVSLSV